jgi:hypothetical protein
MWYIVVKGDDLSCSNPKLYLYSGNSPVVYKTESEAITEAQRLSRYTSGKRLYVFASSIGFSIAAETIPPVYTKYLW